MQNMCKQVVAFSFIGGKPGELFYPAAGDHFFFPSCNVRMSRVDSCKILRESTQPPPNLKVKSGSSRIKSQCGSKWSSTPTQRPAAASVGTGKKPEGRARRGGEGHLGMRRGLNGDHTVARCNSHRPQNTGQTANTAGGVCSRVCGRGVGAQSPAAMGCNALCALKCGGLPARDMAQTRDPCPPPSPSQISLISHLPRRTHTKPHSVP